MKTTKTLCIKFLSIVTIAFFLNACSSNSDDEDDACVPISCLNDGVATYDCVCDCPDGYAGLDCGIQETPKSMTITKIVVTKFPNENDNEKWDAALTNTSDADIYITIEDSSGNIIYEHPSYYENASGLGNVTYEFIPSSPIKIIQTNKFFIVRLFDWDTFTNDDFISLAGFTPYFSGQSGFPASKKFTNLFNDFDCEVFLTYNW